MTTTSEGVLAYLRAHPEGARASEMALALGRPRVSVSSRITELQRDGLVVKARSSARRHGGVVWRLAREGDALGVQRKGEFQREAEERLRQEWASFRRVVLRPLLDTLEQRHDPASREMRAAAFGLADAMEGAVFG